jgi:hypothetical protein
MPITSVNTPSGQVLRINHPEGATEDQIIAFAARQFETSTDDDGLLVDVGKGLLTGGLQAAINAGAGFEQARGMLMQEDEDTSDEAIDAYIAQQPPELGLTREEVLQHRIKKNQAKNKALDNAVRLRDLASSIGERIGLDEDFAQSLPGQIVQGFGQVPVSLAAGAIGGAVGGVPGAVAGVVASAAPQMISEAINDAEGTLKKSFTQMDSEERNQVAMSSMGYVVLGTALESAGFLKTVPGLKNFLRGGGKLTSGQLKSLKREVAEGFAAEGFTESAQGQLLDSFANATYDDDRELMSMNVLGQRFNEFLIGGVVGGGTAGGFGAFERASRGTLFQPRETKPVSTVGKKIFEVTYTDNAGNQRTRPVQASSEQEAEGIALETITDANLDEQFIISEPGIEVTETPEAPKEEVVVTGETIEFDLTPEEIDTINQELANETDPIGQAGDRIPNILDEDDVTAKAFTPYKEEMMPRPEVVEAALPIFRKLKAGERITLEESRNLASVVDRVNPVRPYKEVPPPASEADMRRGLNEGQLPKINKARDVETGTFVKLRLDIPAYRDKGVWVPTIHGATEKTRGFRGGTPISYQSTSVVTNARFGVIGYDNPTGQALAAGIAAKKESKIPVATILGEYVNLSEDQAVARAEAVINDPSFIQVGMDPKRRGYFYNRETMQEVLSADEVIQVGPLVLAKNPVYGKTPSNEFLSREVEGAVDQDVVAEAAPVEKVNATNQIDVVDSTVTQLVEPVKADPAEGGKVRSIAKRFRLKAGIIDFRKLFKTTGSLKVSERVYNSTVKKAADRISRVLDKSFIQFPEFEAWYSSRLNMAMDIFEELDPDLAKPEHRFIMKTLLAVTSNGNEVSDQTAESFRIYKDWKRTGKLEQQATQGTREEAILGHLLLVDELISRVGWKELESFMSKVGPVSDLRKELESKFGFTKKQAKDMTTGELVTEVVPYSLFLGPKLGSFFNNLNGNFETTTMDRWFMRTFGRTMGDQLIKADIQATQTRLFNAIDALISNPKSRLLGELKKQGLLPKSGKRPTKEQIKRIATYFSLKANRQGLTPVENEVRLAINGIAKVSDGFKMIEAPANGSHRRFIRAVMKEALDDFNKKNDTNFTPAEAQAILWYYEKLIHESNGSRQKGEAPDYAAGANAIYRNLNGRDSGRFVRSDVIRRRGDLPSGTQELSERDITAPAAAAADVEAEAITAQRPSAPEGGFDSVRQLEEFIRDNFKAVASKVGVDIVPNYTISTDAQYNVTKGYIEYNPRSMFTNRTQDGTRAAMREEIIHAAMHKVLMQRSPSKSRNNAWLDFMGKLGKDLTQEQRSRISGVYSNLQEDHQFGAEYSRAAIQYLLYGSVTEQYVVGGKSWGTIKSLFKSVQRFLARTLGKEINENLEAAAVINDSVDLVLRSDPDARITNQKIAKESKRISDPSVDTEVIVNAANPPSKKKKIGFYDKFINTASTVLSDISPRIERLFQQYLNKVDSTIQQRLKSISPFIKKFNGIRNEEDKRRLKQLLYYSPSVKGSQDAVALSRERDLLLQKYGMFNDYNLVVRPILDDIRQQANEQGMDVDYLEDYFPRRVLDLAKLEQVLGKTVAVDFRSYIQRINEDRAKETDITKRKPIIEEGSTEEALEFDKYIRSGMYTKRGIMTKHTKARTYEFIEDSAIDFYADPGQAIEVYISNMTTATETMRLLGRRYETDNGQLISPNQDRPGELGLLIQELLQNGEIDSEQAYGTLPDLAKVILNPIMKENSLLASMRTFSYFTLLVEPTTTISQIFDLPFQMYQNGFFRTIRSLLGGKEFRLEDVGISKDDIGAEFRNEKKLLSDALRIGLKATGFSRMDQLMKETTLSANYKRIRSLSRGYLKNRNSKNSVKLKTELDFILGDDADAAIAAFAKGDRDNPFVREVLLRKLLEFQPVNRLEMPLAVSDDPNLRMLYTMKSFMIKQLAFVKNNMLNDIAQGIGTGNAAQALRGSTELAKLMFFMLMVGMPADALKDFLAGRAGYFSDYMFNGVARLFGISRYQTFVARKEGIGQAAFDFITPVGIQQIVDNTAAVQRVLSEKRAITDSKLVTLAPMSDVLNRLFGFSRAGEQREFQRRLREGELPTFIPPGAL